jgi:hypothetical protein
LSISDPAATRERVVRVNFGALEQQVGPGSGLSGTATTVILNLFPDVELTAVLDEASGSMGNPGERLTWIGHVDGSPEDRVLLVAGDGTLAGSVQTRAGQYEIRTLPTDPAYHMVAQIDQGRFKPD